MLSQRMSDHYLTLFHQMIYRIRCELATEYSVNDSKSKTYRFTGLCNRASGILIDRITDYGATVADSIHVNEIHGELAHSSKWLSKYWCYEHTWVRVIINGNQVYHLDPTCGQFYHIDPEIPEYYVGIRPPKWFLMDRDNFEFSSIGRWINDHTKRPDHDGLVTFIEYQLHGDISDMIYHLRQKVKRLRRGG